MAERFRPTNHGDEHRPGAPDELLLLHTLLVVIDSGGIGLTTGVKGDVQLHNDYEILSWTILCDQTGSIAIDIWRDSLANYPPVVGDSITASDQPEVSSDDNATGSSLTGWDTLILAGDTLRFNVDSVSSLNRVTLALELRG